MKRLLFASLLSATACSSAAYADRIAAPAAAGPRTALAIAPAKIRAPYDVQVVREDGETAPTYALKNRFYVQGNMGERYTIRVTNPTPNRVEAVVSVDGLDVVDGDAGDLRKRGYIVPAYGEVKIDGFRTSLDDVATFRFSSVDGSYAGQKGKARNVGVIAVAIFEEQAPPPDQQLVAPPPPVDRPYDWRDDLDSSRGGATYGGYRGGYTKNDKAAPTHAAKPTRTAAAEKQAAPPPAADAATSVGGARAGYGGPSGAPATAAKAPRERFEEAGDDEGGYEQAQPAPKTGRQGLGTEFGEQRNSSATYTRFVRAAGRPVAIAELRYNDAAGLTALGILVQPMPDEGEIMTRETADPFPGDRHFARAAR